MSVDALLTRTAPFLTSWPRRYTRTGTVKPDGADRGGWADTEPKT